jgi:Fanconi-associated nuclease 1
MSSTTPSARGASATPSVRNSPVKPRAGRRAADAEEDEYVDDDAAAGEADADGDEKTTAKDLTHRQVVALVEGVLPTWRALVAVKAEPGMPAPAPGLARFEAGHVLTRVVCKGTHALGKLARFGEEDALLEELLKQRRWRAARRGRWWERRALLGMKGENAKNASALRRACEIVVQALLDDDTLLGACAVPVWAAAAVDADPRGSVAAQARAPAADAREATRRASVRAARVRG